MQYDHPKAPAPATRGLGGPVCIRYLSASWYCDVRRTTHHSAPAHLCTAMEATYSKVAPPRAVHDYSAPKHLFHLLSQEPSVDNSFEIVTASKNVRHLISLFRLA